MAAGERLIHLEAARGIASLIVVFHHVVLAFAPKVKAGFGHGGVENTPLYIAVNGSAAVVFFFALSGFVLTRSLYADFQPKHLARALLKRLPRLMLPAGLTILAGFCIIYFTPPFYKQAAMVSGSRWLASFANGAPQFPPTPEIWDALRQCLMVFLRFDQSYYNSNLWTMAMEFYGSLVVFALAAILGFWRGARFWAVVALHLVAALALFAVNKIMMMAFPLGALIAWLHVNRPGLFTPPRWGAAAMLLIAIACFSVNDGLISLIGASATLMLLMRPGRVQTALGGTWGAWAGTMSFPLYLVHMLVIMAITSPVLLAWPLQSYWARLPLTLAVTLAASVLAALPLVWLEASWLPWLNRTAKALVP